MARMLLRPLRDANRTTVFLLLSLAALNMPRAMVLCIGHDGHMAIEPAAHDHCADGSHARDRGPAGLETGDHSHVDHAHCPPCIDIPISAGAGDERIASQKSKPAPVYVGAFGLTTSTPHVFASSGAVTAIPSWLLPSRSTSLCCTILQV